MTPEENLIARLAAMDPMESDSFYACFFCGGYGWHKSNVQVKAHEPTCLWLQAKELVG